MQRLFALILTVALLPVLALVASIIYLFDGPPIIYVSDRIGSEGNSFRFYKFRSMVTNADKLGGSSTSGDDPRLTRTGRYIRKYKIDELLQLINVLNGTMLFVGPRPNTPSDVALYTAAEIQLLTQIPGITDLSSIVFSDESEILKGAFDPDKRYNSLIRPWKSRLGLLYIRNKSFCLDLRIVVYTIINLFNRPLSLRLVSKEVQMLGGGKELVNISLRANPLYEAELP